MNIEYLKWKFELADGFEIKEIDGHLLAKSPDQKAYSKSLKWFLESNQWENIYHPLLLQRAIEGVNREYDFEIKQHADYLAVLNMKESPEIFEWDKLHTSIDQAKESALMYIWEQTK